LKRLPTITPDELQAFTDTKEMGKVDWGIVALKSSVLEAIPSLIYPLLEPGRTQVLAIMNGLIEEDLIQLLKEHAGESTNDKHLHCCAAVYGGMALVCSNRLGPGRIDHSYAGLLSGGVGASSATITAEENQKAYESLWEAVNVDIAYEPSILGGRWRKVYTFA
jgi:2-dehydropantoate 2-reductase